MLVHITADGNTLYYKHSLRNYSEVMSEVHLKYSAYARVRVPLLLLAAASLVSHLIAVSS